MIPIVTDVDKLKVVSKSITLEEATNLKVFELLKQAVYEHKECVGLSAVQIDMPVNACFFRFKDHDLKLLNPIILAPMDNSSEWNKKVIFKEGCMSFPGKFFNVERLAQIKVKDDINGEAIYEGLEAICVQHEISHMFGRTIMDDKIDLTRRVAEFGPGRNERCPCKSGKKYKKCCGK